MADSRGDSRTAPKIEGGRNHGQNRARTRNALAPGRPQALEANEVRSSALTQANGQETVMQDDREGIAVDLVRWAFRVLRYLEQRPSGSLDELEGGDFHGSISR
jgi:hypothetical protein